jgi:phosphoribosylformylglycinamidine synthase
MWLDSTIVHERPRIAIVREQGVNGQVEMAAAFHRAGFACIDIHMSDLASGRASLRSVRGLVACGGFSFGDVLGAGQGWAKRIMLHAPTRDDFVDFFRRHDTFSLGVCNGCQMLASLRGLIPGAAHFPHLIRNKSEQFEARQVQVEVIESRSILLRDMQQARMPIVVAHGEGRMQFDSEVSLDKLGEQGQLCLRYVDNRGRPTDHYPENPNGSPAGITSVCSEDGRVTLMMPHPERVFRAVQHSWCPSDWTEHGPFMRLFDNARHWVG